VWWLTTFSPISPIQVWTADPRALQAMQKNFHLASAEVDTALEWAGRAADDPIFFGV